MLAICRGSMLVVIPLAVIFGVMFASTPSWQVLLALFLVVMMEPVTFLVQRLARREKVTQASYIFMVSWIVIVAINAALIDNLLIMGTIARSGISGILIGNTAERLLPHVPCSVLALKPDGWKCPIEAD